MVRVVFLILLGSFWITSGTEAHYIINLEMSTDPRIVRPKNPYESLILDETLNVRIVPEIPVVAKVRILLCYVGEQPPSYYFASFLVESEAKNNYILDYNLIAHEGMKGIWYCTLLFDRDPILFELKVNVTNPKVSSKAEIANWSGSQGRRRPAPEKLHHDKRNSAKVKRDINANGTRRHNILFKYKPYDYNAEKQIDDMYIINQNIYGYRVTTQNYDYGTRKQDNHMYANKQSNQEPGTYKPDEPQMNKTTSNTNKHHNDQGAQAPQYDDNKENIERAVYIEQADNENKDNNESAKDIKMFVIFVMTAGSGILIGIIVGVLCRMKCKTRDSEPIVTFTTADPVYDNVYSTKLDSANRPPHPLPFEEREENKQYIHYDTPYDHRCGWKRPPQAVTFMK